MLFDMQAAAEKLRASCLAAPEAPDPQALAMLVNCCASDDEAIAVHAAKLLIGHVVEDLSDRFEPALADAYISIFSEALAACQPVWSAPFLRGRYQQLRGGAPPKNTVPITRVYVLSRITLGADIAITSVFLDAASKRYPAAKIWLVGPPKNAELFGGSGRINHWPLDYPRGGTLRTRIGVAEHLAGLCDEPGTLIIDPDSRISQLGLLPLGPATRTLFFESRTAESESCRTLSDIASSFCFLRLGVPDAAPFLSLPQAACDAARCRRQALSEAPIAVSLGVGGNPNKRLSGEFEAALFGVLASTGRPLWVDAGAGGAEADGVRAAIAAAGLPASRVHVLDGSFALFCAHIAESAVYLGYDSAGQHAASALEIPSITLFRGFVNETMLARWTPRGARSQVLPVAAGTPEPMLLENLRNLVGPLRGRDASGGQR